jgi:hypothetical protein
MIEKQKHLIIKVNGKPILTNKLNQCVIRVGKSESPHPSQLHMLHNPNESLNLSLLHRSTHSCITKRKKH